jgi:hypothetical protein
MNRTELAEKLQGSDALALAQTWSFVAQDLLSRIHVGLGQDDQRSPLERAVLAQTRRIRRYLLALSRLTFVGDEATGRLLHCVDGAHAIHKSLFETYIEFALCLTYARLFDPEKDEDGNDLGQRLYLYSDFAKRKRNRERLFRLDQWRALLSKMSGTVHLSPGTEEFFAKGVDGVKQDLVVQAKRIAGKDARFTQLSHWFPEKRPDGRYFVKAGDDDTQRPRNCGSIEWACKAVLALHFPEPQRRDWWEHQYDQYYDQLNLFAHPVLGYDDAFRRESERLVDLARMQIGVRFDLHFCVLPSMKAMFSAACVPHLQRLGELDDLFQRLNRLVLPVLMLIDQSDYQPSRA